MEILNYRIVVLGSDYSLPALNSGHVGGVMRFMVQT